MAPLTTDWIVGFVDGDGCFSIRKSRNKFRLNFIVSQDKRSSNVLYALQDFFGCGYVHKSGGTMMEYSVGRLSDLSQKIILFFMKNKLRSVKRYDFARFYLTCESLIKGLDLSDVISKILDDITPPPITKEWFAGFADAESSFLVSYSNKRYIHQFVIGLHSKDKFLIEQLRIFVGAGVIYTRKNGVMIFQVSSLKDLTYHLLPIFEIPGEHSVRLRTNKRMDFLKFRRILRYLKEAPTLHGKILHLISVMRPYRKSLK